VQATWTSATYARFSYPHARRQQMNMTSHC